MEFASKRGLGYRLIGWNIFAQVKHSAIKKQTDVNVEIDADVEFLVEFARNYLYPGHPASKFGLRQNRDPDVDIDGAEAGDFVELT